ncbi:DNA replication initiation control protein YabA [Ligilactobacillus salitolerans]|uniref:Replication initiation control protein YabA n=1 Tax=Ligilactobacillus salitolerans TaxID=1808352 RepID=A0A401IVI3_9LACO|nr:DNA replication initiation control protein YabA [Ligilactobacillus salitolerans]GBG95518.1 DNA replication initiation control protein YabA [Ligilactobacillus salitolerans]
MDKRQLYDNLEHLGTTADQLRQMIGETQQSMAELIERNAELEIENQHLREHLRELEDKSTAKNTTSLSKSRQNLEKLYEEGFHVCNVDNMYGSRRVNDEPCVFCQDVIYGERN